METFDLKYGNQSIKLSQSSTLIGVKPKRSRLADAEEAVQRTLSPGEYKNQGVLGGFHIISVDEKSVDADNALDKLRMDGSVQVGTHVFEVPDGKGIFVPTGDIFVEFKPGTTKVVKEKAIDKFRLTVKETRGSDGFILAVTPQSPNPIKVASGLQKDSSVAVAEPDLASKAVVKAGSAPTDSLLSEQWHLRNSGFHRNTDVGFKSGADARVIDAWATAGTFGRPDVVVAVIDDGFDLDHPDLSVPGKLIHPWDFTRGNNAPVPDIGDWHGTACAGVAVAAVGAGGVVGAAPGCTLMPVRWGVNLSDAQIEGWFDYVTAKGAWVVSCSWGAANPFFPLSTRAHRAIEKCAKQGRSGKGCVVVFAAGNSDHDINDPAGGTLDGFAVHPEVIAVAASTSMDARSNYSNYGEEISVCAPSSGAGGWGILTSDVTGIDPRTGSPLGYATGDYTYDFGGTSSACPLVAGIAAIVLSVNPNLTSSEVKTVLQDTARKIGKKSDYSNGHSKLFGFGCVDAAAAVKAVSGVVNPPGTVVSLTGKVSPRKSKRKVRVTA
ncbi:S8 family serine peptidase [Ensifer aridi]|uniref:S8 family serine peptidase n=1 Tax=Ensifer aridi TaxID=1708715 RepID=UPI00358EEE1E